MGRMDIVDAPPVAGRRGAAAAATRTLRLGADAASAAMAAAGVLSTMGAVSGKADQVANFAPLWAAAGLAAGGASIALAPPSRRRLRIAVAAITLLAGAWLMAPELVATRPAADPAARPYRIVALNAWILNKKPELVLRWIAGQGADALVMSELPPRSPIRKTLLASYPHLVACRETGPCSTVIMTRAAPLSGGGLATGDADRRQDISAVWATVDAPGGPITILGTHLDHPGPMGTGRDEMSKLRDFVSGRDRSRLVVIGDTNRTAWSHAIRVLDRTLGIRRITHGLPTWPAGRIYPPLFGIDQAYVGPGLGVRRLERSPDVGSDHLGLVLDVADAARG